MKRIKKKLTAMLNAITFAEAGEHQTAVECLDEDSSLSREKSLNEYVESTAKSSALSRAEKHFLAATFAEAGEFETALEIMERPAKAVLLLSGGSSAESHAFNFAVNLCRRIEASLEILAIHGKAGNDNGAMDETSYEFMKSQCAQQHGVSCTIGMLSGNPQKDLIEYVRKHKEIAAMIYGSHNAEPRGKNLVDLLQTLETIVDRFSIPLVKVLNK